MSSGARMAILGVLHVAICQQPVKEIMALRTRTFSLLILVDSQFDRLCAS